MISIEEIKSKMVKKIKCPHCGYEMPICYTDEAIAKGIFVRCKGRTCRKEFEIKLRVK